MQRAAASSSDSLVLRLGIDAGEAVCEDGDYFGRPVIIARRLCDRAAGGQIVASDALRSLVDGPGSHAFAPLGALALKGLSDPVGASALEWAPVSPPGGVAPHRGRRFESHEQRLPGLLAAVTGS
jgi:class 3 adenylate cyclase